MRPPVEAELLGIPSVTIVSPTFVGLTKAMGKSVGIADLGTAVWPGAFGIFSKEQIREALENGVVDQIVDVLTRNAGNGEATATPNSVAVQPQSSVVTVFAGSFDEVNSYFHEKEWTDHLPIVPPTKERVEQFLKYTDRDPDEVVAVLPADNLKATPRIIATNGVMAGCRPEHMPILIAGVEAMAVPRYNLTQIGTSWATYPYFVLNGPIVKQLGVARGQGEISLGPNPSLGRAFELMIKNIAGFRPGETRMGTFGYLQPPFFAEDEDYLSKIGWKPYHAEEGLDPRSNAITAAGAWSWADQMSVTIVKMTRAEDLLDCFVHEVFRKVRPTKSIRGGPWGNGGTIGFFITGPAAQFLQQGGFSRREAIDYIAEKTYRTPLEWVEWWVNAGGRLEVGLEELKILVGMDSLPKNTLERVREKIVPIVNRPKEQIKIFVTGDDGRAKTQLLYGWYVTPITKEIKLPASWDQMLRRVM